MDEENKDKDSDEPTEHVEGEEISLEDVKHHEERRQIPFWRSIERKINSNKWNRIQRISILWRIYQARKNHKSCKTIGNRKDNLLWIFKERGSQEISYRQKKGNQERKWQSVEVRILWLLSGITLFDYRQTLHSGFRQNQGNWHLLETLWNKYKQGEHFKWINTGIKKQ